MMHMNLSPMTSRRSWGLSRRRDSAGSIVKGRFGIYVMMKDCFGKRPGLYIYNGAKNYTVKVGNFASEEKAKLFEKYLCYMCGIAEEPKEDAQ